MTMEGVLLIKYPTMTIWLGFLIIVFIGGILLWERKPIWQTVIVALLVLLISMIYFLGWNF